MTRLESFEIHCKIIFKIFTERFPDFCNWYRITRNDEKGDRIYIDVERFGLRYSRSNMTFLLSDFTDGWIYNVISEFLDTVDLPHRYYDGLGYSLTDEFKALFQLYIFTEIGS